MLSVNNQWNKHVEETWKTIKSQNDQSHSFEICLKVIHITWRVQDTCVTSAPLSTSVMRTYGHNGVTPNPVSVHRWCISVEFHFALICLNVEGILRWGFINCIPLYLRTLLFCILHSIQAFVQLKTWKNWGVNLIKCWFSSKPWPFWHTSLRKIWLCILLKWNYTHKKKETKFRYKSVYLVGGDN